MVPQDERVSVFFAPPLILRKAELGEACLEGSLVVSIQSRSGRF
jgi:hypothetical protein